MTGLGLRSCAVVAVIACLAGAACGREEPAATTPVQLVAGPSAMPSGPGAAAGPRLPAAGAAGDDPASSRSLHATSRSRSAKSSSASTATACAGPRRRPTSISRATSSGRRSTCATASTSATTRRPCRRCSTRLTAGASRRCAGTRRRGAVAFPPRNEPYAFRQELEAQVPGRAAAQRHVLVRRHRGRDRVDAGVPAVSRESLRARLAPRRRCSTRSTGRASPRSARTR